MKVILFGATGMVGQGVLRECLHDAGVTQVLTIGRRSSGHTHPKLQELVQEDLTDFEPIADRLTGYDACFFCLGVTSAGLSEDAYRRVTHDIAVSAGRLLADRNPGLTFVFVSGAGTDSHSRTMWARVKGQTEDALFAMPFKAAYAFRPAFIQASHGERSRTASYRYLYVVLGPLIPLVRRLWPNSATSTEAIGRAMLRAVRDGAPKRVLESRDINALAAQAG